MKLTGKEIVSLCIEKNTKTHFKITQFDFKHLLNDFICEKVLDASKQNKQIEKFDIKYININNLKLPKEVSIKLNFEIFTKASPSKILDKKYTVSIKVKDFYNFIVKLFENLAKKYNTTIWNIGLNPIELKLLDGKPITKVKIFSSNNYYFKDYIDVIGKYSMEDIELKKDEETGNYYIKIEVESLNFLPKLQQDLFNIRESIDGLIFNVIEDWYYYLEIYDGYRE